MKKRKKEILSESAADKIVILLFFIAGFFSLNILENSIATNSLGIAFIIAAVYGLVLVLKGEKFIF